MGLTEGGNEDDAQREGVDGACEIENFVAVCSDFVNYVSSITNR